MRGVRINLASVGAGDPAAADAELRATAARVAPPGWHVDLHAGLDVIAAPAETITAARAPVVDDEARLVLVGNPARLYGF